MRILLLGHGRMGALVESLASEYGGTIAGVIDERSGERAIADGTFGGVDVAIDFTLADAVIYVVKSDSTLIPHVQKGVSQLQNSNAPVIGVVLNHVDIEKAKKNGQFRGYYDHYGYSEQQTV